MSLFSKLPVLSASFLLLTFSLKAQDPAIHMSDE